MASRGKEFWTCCVKKFLQVNIVFLPSYVNAAQNPFAALLARIIKFLSELNRAHQSVRFQSNAYDFSKPIMKPRLLSLSKCVDVLTLYTLTSVCIFSTLLYIHFLRSWQREFVCQPKSSFPGDHFLYSHDLNVRFRSDVIGRNWMLVTLRIYRDA